MGIAKSLDSVMQAAQAAFETYRQSSLQDRLKLMEAIAERLSDAKEELVPLADSETFLGAARLQNELSRTIFQLRSYGAACAQGNWLETRINTGDAAAQPSKPDLRKMLVPLGPVVVFGASNFPFAYSTAGGDTACALAAGCSVVVKAHSAHLKTSMRVAELVADAVQACGLPEALFQHVEESSFEAGQALVQHPLTAAVGFTGSFSGGKALFDLANKREKPIPVFAEMGSVNPVFILPQKLAAEPQQIAEAYAASINLSVGQFCTNPGLLIAIEGEGLEAMKKALSEKFLAVAPAKMLHEGIAKSFVKNRAEKLKDKNVTLIAEGAAKAKEGEGTATIATVSAQNFLKTPYLQEEVFGPFSLLIVCKDVDEMKAVAQILKGQLTASIMATESELAQQKKLITQIQNLCGRIIFNGVPTGVEPVLAMHHGGPFPATTDSRFTSVGADGIKRFARPQCFQNWPDALLPDALKNSNPLHIWRTVNNALTRDAIT